MRLNTIMKILFFLVGIFIGREFLLMIINTRRLSVHNFKKLSSSPKYISVSFSGCFGLGNRVSYSRN